jgi:RNA polymerase sigma-70 factor (ECF subfamily)
MDRAAQKSPGMGGASTRQVVRPLKFEGDDRALVRALRADHPGAYKVLYQRYANEILKVLYRVLGPDEEMDELLHDVFVRAFRNVDGIRDPEKLKAWLTGIALFAARGAIRRRRRGRWLRFFDPSMLPGNAAPSPPDDVRRALRRTYELLDKLSYESRVAFTLRYIDGRELTEIAEVTGVSLATAKRRLKSARHRFFAMARNEPELEEWLNDD